MPPELADPIAQQIATFLLGGGAVGAVAALGRFIYKWRTGRIALERDRNTSLVNDRVTAVQERREMAKERDEADRKRRAEAEENGRLRRLLIQNGIEPGPELDYERTQKPPRNRTTDRKRNE